ncbi:MAG: polysaccharide deacetylase family protein, partial [Bacteroidota bacterium]
EHTIRHMHARDFETHVKYLKKNFQILPISEIFERYKAGKPPKRKTIGITFDDGYENNLLAAAPILDKHKVPGAFYILTAPFSNPDFIIWADQIDVLHNVMNVPHLDLNGERFEAGPVTYLHASSGLSVYDYIKNLDTEVRDTLLDGLQAQFQVRDRVQELPSEYWRLVDEAQLRQLASSDYCEIGSHTVNHFNLGKIAPEAARIELRESRQTLERILDRPIDTIAFPDGDYTSQVKAIAREEGYSNLLAVIYRESEDAGERDILPRMGISTTTTWQSNMVRLHRSFGEYGF